MNVPQGMTEAEVLEAIETAVTALAPSFVFGYFDVDDIKQYGRMFAVQAMNTGQYDPSRPLANFIYSSIRNRFINLRRDKLRRNDPPCKSCHEGNPCGAFGQLCSRYSAWLKRNHDKASIMQPLDLNNISDERERRTRQEDNVSSRVEFNELVQRIRSKLPADLQSTFLQMRDGVTVPKAKRKQVEDAIREIVACDEED